MEQLVTDMQASVSNKTVTQELRDKLNETVVTIQTLNTDVCCGCLLLQS